MSAQSEGKLKINSWGIEQLKAAENNVKGFANNYPENQNIAHINIFLDGTSNNGESPATDEIPTNVYFLYRKSKNGNDNSIYIKGIGSSDKLTSDQIPIISQEKLQQGLVIGADKKQLEASWKEYLKAAKKILQENPNAEIQVNVVGFSRGAAVARELINRIDQLGVPETDFQEKLTSANNYNLDNVYKDGHGNEFQEDAYFLEAENKKYLKKPGEVKQTAMLFDTVGTGMKISDLANDNKNPEQSYYINKGNYPFRQGIPASVTSAVHFVAQDEIRDRFFGNISIRSSENDSQKRLLELAIPGAH